MTGSDFLDKLFTNIGKFFITSLAGITTFLFFDFLYGLILSFTGLKPFTFTAWIWKIVWDSGIQNTPLLILMIYAVIWSWGKTVYILSSLLHDRLKGNYIEGSCRPHHQKFLMLRKKVIEKIKEIKLFNEENDYSDYVLYYLLREFLEKEKRKALKGVTQRALEFGFLGLSAAISLLTVSLFYAFETSGILYRVLIVLFSLLLFALAVFFTFNVVRERYISRNFQLYLLFLIKDYLKKDEKKND